MYLALICNFIAQSLDSSLYFVFCLQLETEIITLPNVSLFSVINELSACMELAPKTNMWGFFTKQTQHKSRLKFVSRFHPSDEWCSR